jgi:hypothetical protein
MRSGAVNSQSSVQARMHQGGEMTATERRINQSS